MKEKKLLESKETKVKRENQKKLLLLVVAIFCDGESQQIIGRTVESGLNSLMEMFRFPQRLPGQL